MTDQPPKRTTLDIYRMIERLLEAEFPGRIESKWNIIGDAQIVLLNEGSLVRVKIIREDL